jgi:hypothetical protein
MTSPRFSSRVLLIADRPPGHADDAGGIRRYRLARLSFSPRPTEGEARHEHLKRTFD